MLTILLLTLFDPHADAKIEWNKAGTWGAYTYDDSRGTSDFVEGYGQAVSLYVVNRSRSVRKRMITGRWPRLTKDSPESDEFVFPSIESWAPDDVHVLFWKGHYMSVSIEAHGCPLFDLNVKTGEIRKLSQDFKKQNGYDDDRLLFGDAIAFSPDGKKLLLALGSGKLPVWNKRIALLDYQTLKRKWLTSFDVAATSPSWSPDGERILYTAAPTELPAEDRGIKKGSMEEMMALVGLQRTWIMNADGTGKRRLTNERDSNPVWRSKNVIEFIRDETQVWSMRPDGSAQKYVRELGDGQKYRGARREGMKRDNARNRC